MKLITFQPKLARKILKHDGVYRPIKNENLDQVDYAEEGIFCLPVDENTRARLYITGVAYPQVGIVFETEDYEEVDSIFRANSLAHEGYVGESNTKYKEYIVNEVKLSQVIEFIDVSESDDVDTVLDDFYSIDYPILDKLSGKRWRDLSEVFGGLGIFETTEESIEFADILMHCIAPLDYPTSEEEYDKAIELIYRYLTF